MEPRPEHRIPVHKALEVVPPGPGQPGADGPEAVPVVELPHHGGAELIVHRPGEEEGDALPEGSQVQAGPPRRLPIPLRAVFDVHGHIVHQPLLHQPAQPVRMAAVGVQLYRKAQLLDLAQKLLQLRPEQRLSPGDAHPVQQALPFFQKRGQFSAVQGSRGLPLHQLSVVAEGTAQIAPP